MLTVQSTTWPESNWAHISLAEGKTVKEWAETEGSCTESLAEHHYGRNPASGDVSYCQGSTILNTDSTSADCPSISAAALVYWPLTLNVLNNSMVETQPKVVCCVWCSSLQIQTLYFPLDPCLVVWWFSLSSVSSFITFLRLTLCCGSGPRFLSSILTKVILQWN